MPNANRRGPSNSYGDKPDSAYAGLLTLTAVAVVVAILHLAQEVLLPIALAILLSFLLSPLVKRLERWRLGRVPAVVLTVGLTFGVIVGIGWIVTHQFLELTAQIPSYEDTLRTKIRSIRATFHKESSVSEATKTVEELTRELTNGPETEAAPVENHVFVPEPVPLEFPEPLTPDEQQAAEAEIAERLPIPVQIVETVPVPIQILRDWLGPLLAPLGMAAIVVVFVIFMLIMREDLRDRLIRLAGTGRIYLTTQALDEAAARVSRYLLMLFVVNATYGVAVGLGLFLLGLPNAMLWGLLATVFRFVPYIGPWVAAVLPITLSVVVFEGWTLPLLTVALFVVLELVSNNVMEPWLYGTSTGVSVVGIIVSAVFWTWLWGPVGLVLATPLTVCLTVLGRHVPRLNFLNVLLSDQPALELNVRFYQRLLAFDDHEATELASDFLKTGSLDELYEQMLIPALSYSERDRHAGHQSEAQRRFIHRTVQDLIDELGEQFSMSAAAEAVPEGAAAAEAEAGAEKESETPEPRSLRILCVPAMDRADRLAGLMLVQLLSARGHQAEMVRIRITDGHIPQILAEKRPDGLLISALAPGGAAEARDGCRRLHPRFPDVKLIVGLWNARGALTKTRARLEAAGADFVTTSVSEALDYVREYAESESQPENATPVAAT